MANLMESGWGGLPPMATSRAKISLEVTVVSTRADIVVEMPDGVLVIENKMWASERAGQCEDLYTEWTDRRENVRFLLISRRGLPPVTTRSRAAAAAWRSLSYGAFATLLGSTLADLPGDSSSGRATAKQYLATLVGMSLTGAPFYVTIGGGQVND